MGISRRTLSVIAAGRQGQTSQPAGSTLRQTRRFTHHCNSFPLVVRRQYFRPNATCNASLSSIASASSFLRRAFSSSGDLRRFTSGTSMPQTSYARYKTWRRKWHAYGRVPGQKLRLQPRGEY